MEQSLSVQKKVVFEENRGLSPTMNSGDSPARFSANSRGHSSPHLKKEGFLPLEFKRIQSPSSINTYKQCPRKYYYQYVLKLATQPSIHLIRGSITHSVLEDFFKIDVTQLSPTNFEDELHIITQDLFHQEWDKAAIEFNKLTLLPIQIRFFFDETKLMLHYWVGKFIKKLRHEMKTLTLQEAFKKWTPLREESYISSELGVRGFIDAIHTIDNEIVLMDYKTSKRTEISPEYKLQLAIYALLYKEKHGIIPKKVGLDFLKGSEMFLDVDDELLEMAKTEVENIHINTESEEINDFPQHIGPLCKWRDGHCDFYGLCFEQKKITDYAQRIQEVKEL